MIHKNESKHIVADGFEEIYYAILEKINSQFEYEGSARGEFFKEVTNLSFELLDPRNRFVWTSARRANYDFAMRFFIWMFNGCDDADYLLGINPNAKSYMDYKNEVDNKFSTAYGPRIMKQLPTVMEELERDPESRRGSVIILQAEDQQILGQETKVEYPCIQTMNFYIRYNRLNCLVNMRSNNMATTVVYDVFAFTMFQEYVYKHMKRRIEGLQLGTYQHHCISAHYFINQQALVDAVLNCPDPFFFRNTPIAAKGETK